MQTATLDAPTLPRRLQVEVTASCNLSCRMCIVRYQPKQPRSASMDFTAFQRLLHDLPGVDEIVLQGVGEPLLAPDLYHMIEWASGRGIRTEFNTNATLLTRRAGERLLDAGLSALHISFDGATPETYEFIRDNASFDVVHRNISGFVDLMRERGASQPALSLVTVLMKRNLDEIPGIVRHAAGWGIPEVFVQSLSHDFSDAPDEDAFEAIAAYVDEQHIDGLPREQVEAAYFKARCVASDLGVDLRLPALDPRPEPVTLEDGTPVGCDWPWTGGYVTRDGTVLPCCMVMGEGRIEFGNVHERSYPEIWESEDFQRFREGLANGDPHPVCRGCALYQGRF